MNELVTSLSASLDTNLSSLQTFSDDQQTVHNFIVSRLPNAGEPLSLAAAHHFFNSGKMLRAKMVMRGAHLLSVDNAAAIRWAAAVELLHNASLVHDDICDGDKLRRGQQAVWAKFGRHVALTLGDWLIALSFELASEAAQIAKTPKLVTLLARHMATTTAGEAMEFDFDRKNDWDTYLQIAADKTAPLLTAPLQGVAIMALDARAEMVVASYFRYLGKAYQVANDILNFDGNDGAKSIGSDLARRAPNAVTLSFRDCLSPTEQAKFDSWYEAGDNAALFDWQVTIRESDAMERAGRCMLSILEDAERKAESLSVEIYEVISPVHALLKRVCLNSVKNLKV
jgi:geranylgeranyl pyrophosphate synthase